MTMYLRDNNRYGLFEANSNIGKINIQIDIYGFGELITIYQNDKKITSVDTLEDNDFYYEDKDIIEIDCFDVIIIDKKTLKRIIK